MTRTKSRQIALFSDREVRRDYLKSPQWVDQHVKIKVHLTGYAVAYESGAQPKRDPDRPPLKGRYQGSLFNQQKHAIADAVEWIRQNSQFRPRIFVATTPGFIDHPAEGRFIQKLVHNLKNGYGMTNYVWVRELTGNGYPHFHFVADVDKFDPVKLSLYWSGLFDSDAKNSIRLGTRPGKNGQRRYWINSQRMAWYMTKYLGKSFGESEKKSRKAFRTFAISQQAKQESQPLIYEGRVYNLYNGLHSREFHLSGEQLDTFADSPERMPPVTVDARNYRWKWTGHGRSYTGFLK